MKIFIATMFLLLANVGNAQLTTSDVWINEFHYDHITSRGDSDTIEFVELVIKNSIATNPVELAKYKVMLYTSGALDNGALNLGRGLPYNVSGRWYSEAETNHPLSGFQQCPVAGSNFTILYKKLPILQDIPAAIAIVYDNTTVVQLLSYEKAFGIESAARNGGPAAGMRTELITKPGGAPAMENALTPTNHSVSLLGSGSSYSNFQWDDGPTVTSTPCARNTNGTATQTFTAAVLPIKWLSVSATGGRDFITVDWRVSNNNEVDFYEIELAQVNASYSKVGRVNGKTSPGGIFRSTISNVNPGTYKLRIRSTSLIGEQEYSEVKVVRIGSKNAPVLTVYPNPVKGNIANVQVTPLVRSSFTIQVVDVNGKVLSSKQTALFEANTVNNVSINLQNISKGIYYVKLINETEQLSTKLVVLK